MKIYVVKVLGDDPSFDHEAIITEDRALAYAEFDLPLGDYEVCKSIYVWENGIRHEFAEATKRS